MKMRNSAISNLQTDIIGLLSNIDLIITNINSNILTINTNSGVTPGLTWSNISTGEIATLNNNFDTTLGELSDKIIISGKDLIAVADQANTFICVSIDTFSRIIDTYLYIGTGGLSDYLINHLNILHDNLQILDAYITSRLTNISAAEITATQTTINLDDKALSDLSNIVDKINNINNICTESVNAISIIQDTMIINTIVGITLSVSKHSWNELKLMHQLPYTSVVDAPVVSTTTTSSATLVSNTNYPTEGFSDSYKDNISKLIKQIFLKDAVYQNSDLTYKIVNENTQFEGLNIPKEFHALTSAQILNLPKKDIIRLEPIMLDVVFVEQLDITDAVLTAYYNTLTTSVKLSDFLLYFKSSEFLNLYNKYIDHSVINEYNNYIQDEINFKLFSDSLNTFNTFVYSSKLPNGISLFNSSTLDTTDNSVNQLPLEMINYIKTSRQTYLSNAQHLVDLDNFKIIFNANLPSLVNEQKQGTISINKYQNDKLVEIISLIDYKYNIYKDEYNIYYAECEVNKTKFILKGNNLTISYNIKTDQNITSVVNIKLNRVITEFLKIDGLLSTNVMNDVVITPYLFNEHRVTTTNDAATGDKTVLTNDIVATQNINLIFDITNDSSSVHTNFTYVSDNRLERITTNITNYYRQKMLDNVYDFNEARTRSILESLTYFGYRQSLENFINDTWTALIPRIERG